MSSIVLERFGMEQQLAEPWNNTALLIQPLLDEQALLYDTAQCLATTLYLKMCGLDYRVEEAPNTADMAPGGSVPLLVCGSVMVSGFDKIVELVGKKTAAPPSSSPPPPSSSPPPPSSSGLNDSDRTDMECYLSMVHSAFTRAEHYTCWLESDTYRHHTVPRFSSVHPWPLSQLLLWLQARKTQRYLTSFGNNNKADTVFEELSQCCESLAARLYSNNSSNNSNNGNSSGSGGAGFSHTHDITAAAGTGTGTAAAGGGTGAGAGCYFFGARPCALDALVAGHVLAIESHFHSHTHTPNAHTHTHAQWSGDSRLRRVLAKYTVLGRMARRLGTEYAPDFFI